MGSQSGQRKRRNESFQAQVEGPLGTDSYQTISKRSTEYWLLTGHKKCFNLYYCFQSANSMSWVLFMCSYMMAIVSPYLSDLFTKEMLTVRKLSLWYKPRSFQNTVYLTTKTWKQVQGYFKDTFPKIQAWANNSYLCLHPLHRHKCYLWYLVIGHRLNLLGANWNVPTDIIWNVFLRHRYFLLF